MLFRWVDKVIERKAANAFNFFRKVGRRSERVYYTAYKDWLVFMSRRSRDMAVKITLCSVAICFVLISGGIRRQMYLTFQIHSKSVRVMEDILDQYNETGSFYEDKTIVHDVDLVPNEQNALILREFVAQRDK